MTTDVDALLKIARATLGKIRFCFAVTVSASGGMNARIVEPSKPDEDWRLWFWTNRRTRKVREIEATGRLLLGYQHDPEGSCVTLHGKAKINGDTARKRQVWTEDFDRWFPGGPEDADVVLVQFEADRIEIWSSAHDVMPGYGSARLDRQGQSWRYSAT
ncbi:MAG: pyridoxamine 5'-phosphate oxidase family protein [Pseudomonadota bacterium]